MADHTRIAPLRLDAVALALCRQRAASLGIATCKARGRRCPWPGSCEILADAAIRATWEFDDARAKEPANA